MKFNILIFILILASFGLSSCDKTCNTTRSIRILTEHKWRIDSYIDYSINQEMYISPELYEFGKDGSVTKIRNNDTIRGEWSIPECSYLKINSMTFKVAEMSRKMMVLRYGEVDFVYRSDDGN